NNSVTESTLVYFPSPINVNQLIADVLAANISGTPLSVTLPANTTYDFTSAYSSTQSALPALTGNLTIEGNGDTIDRSAASGTPAFRLFDVASGGSLTLENVTLTGGLAKGTGAAAEGGAIYSSGTLDLSSVTVTSNQAQEGGAIYSSGTL